MFASSICRIASVITPFVLMFGCAESVFAQSTPIGPTPCYAENLNLHKDYGNGALVDGKCPGVAEYPGNQIGIRCDYSSTSDAKKDERGRCKKLAMQEYTVTTCATFFLEQKTIGGVTFCQIDEDNFPAADDQELSRKISYTKIDTTGKICYGQ